MHRPDSRGKTPFVVDARPKAAAVGALGLGALYLWWRSSTLVVDAGVVALTLSLLILAIEAWSWLELGILSGQTWQLPPPPPRGDSTETIDPVDIAVIAAGAELDDVERTLIAVRAVRSRGQIVVIDEARRIRHRSLVSKSGARYRIDPEVRRQPGLAAHRGTGTDRYLWLEAGQLPLPDLIEVTAPRFERDDMAVCQLAVGLLNADDLAHLGRDRDDDALLNRVVGPALSRFDAGPWTGPASMVCRRAVDEIGGFDGSTIERLAARLHSRGWATSFEARRLVASIAPEVLEDYLARRRRRAAAALRLLASTDGPLVPSAMGTGQRFAHLGAAVRYGTGVRLLLVAVAVVAVVLTGVFPIDAAPWSLAAFWSATSLAGALARRELARGHMRFGDWVRLGWRVLGAEVGAVYDVITRRGRETSGVAAGPSDAGDGVGDRPSLAATGFRALAALPLLDALVVAVDVSLLARAATVFDRDLLPPFRTGHRVMALGFAVTILIPIVDVLQVVVRRQQRRSTYRITTALAATVDGTPAVTLDITSTGVGILLPYIARVGDYSSVEITLPGADGVTRRIVAGAVVRSVRPEGEGRWRVGFELAHLAVPAREALVAFCARASIPADADAGQGAGAAEPAVTPARRSVRRLTVGAGLAGLATLVFGPGVAVADFATPGLVDRVCAADAGGEPVSHIVIERLVGQSPASPSPLGATDATGCLTVGAVPGTEGFALVHRGARYVAQPADYSGTEVRVALVPWEVRVFDADAAPVPSAGVRFFTDRWLEATAVDAGGGSFRFESLPTAPGAELSIEVGYGGSRYVTTMGEGTSRSVVLARLRVDPEAVAAASVATGLLAIDRGSGWELVDEVMDLAPGPLVVRGLGDGTLRIEIPEGHELRLPAGDLVALPVELPVPSTTEPSTTEPSTTGPGSSIPSTTETGTDGPGTTETSLVATTPDATTAEPGPAPG